MINRRPCTAGSSGNQVIQVDEPAPREVLPAIEALDADVTSIEASRSRMEILDDLRDARYGRGIGRGVWDIHWPRVPSQAEIVEALSPVR